MWKVRNFWFFKAVKGSYKNAAPRSSSRCIPHGCLKARVPWNSLTFFEFMDTKWPSPNLCSTTDPILATTCLFPTTCKAFVSYDPFHLAPLKISIAAFQRKLVIVGFDRREQSVRFFAQERAPQTP